MGNETQAMASNIHSIMTFLAVITGITGSWFVCWVIAKGIELRGK